IRELGFFELRTSSRALQVHAVHVQTRDTGFNQREMSEIGVGLNRSTRHLDQRFRRGLPDAGNLIMAERPDELLAPSQGRPVENINVCETPASAVRCSHAAARRKTLSDRQTLYEAQIASVRRLPNRSTSAAAPRPLSFPEHRTSD